ncbi:ribosomal protein S6 [Amylocystis lapponica]|nr:ribosomal protein S6 [Amylocystis lapponica]
MPFYQVLCITAHYPEYRHIKELIQQSATLVMNQGGVVRKVNSWGTFTLPQRMRRHQQYQQIGDYWSMHFDASPRTLHGLNQLMRRDPRVVRWTMLKLGEKVEEVVQPKEKTIERP